MQKKNNGRHILIVAVASLIAISTAAASIMAGCGDSSDKKKTSVVTETSVVASVVDNTNASGGENSQSSEKGESNSNSSSKSSSSKSNNTSSEANESSKSGSSSTKSAVSDSASAVSSFKNENSTHSSTKVCKVDGNKYYVGDTVTCTFKLTSPQKLENYQAYINYDSKYLKVTSAKLSKPASASGMINYSNLKDTIKFLGSDITTGYDYTKGGNFLTVKYKVLAEGSTKTTFHWEVATGFLPNEKSYVTNGTPASGLNVTKSFS